MSDETPRLKLAQLVSLQELNTVTWNEALAQLDALVDLVLLGQYVNTPPSSPAEGDAYLLGGSPTGAWSGYAYKIASCLDGAWRFYAPFAGLTAFLPSAPDFLVYTGSAWQSLARLLPLQNLARLGIGTTADDANRLAVKSSTLLFDNAGGDVQVKVNKHASTDTASLLLQTGYSGRAEIGLCGDDHVHIKTSADGATWREAVTIRADTGWVGLNTANPGSPLEIRVDGSVPDSSWYSAEDLVICKESNGIGFSGFVASTLNKRMVFAGRRARGTLAAPAAVAEGDWTFSLLGSGYDGTTQRATAAITFSIDGAVASATLPQRITFETGPASSRSERVRINATGEMGVGKTATAGVLLDVAGPVSVGSYTVASLPSPAQTGQIVFVSNESGGAVLAFSDGTNWRRVTDRAVVS